MYDLGKSTTAYVTNVSLLAMLKKALPCCMLNEPLLSGLYSLSKKGPKMSILDVRDILLVLLC